MVRGLDEPGLRLPPVAVCRAQTDRRMRWPARRREIDLGRVPLPRRSSNWKVSGTSRVPILRTLSSPAAVAVAVAVARKEASGVDGGGEIGDEKGGKWEGVAGEVQ